MAVLSNYHLPVSGAKPVHAGGVVRDLGGRKLASVTVHLPDGNRLTFLIYRPEDAQVIGDVMLQAAANLENEEI